MSEKTNIYRVFGLRRSGNHVLINWLRAQLPGNVDFYNNIYLNDPILRAPDNSKFRKDGNNNIILSYEDRNLDFAADPKWIKKIADAHDAKVTDILLLRSPLNLFASRIRSKMIKPLFFSGMSVPELLYQYCTYQNYSDDWINKFGGTLHVVYFDDFIESSKSREELAHAIGLEYKSVNMSAVDTRFGQGSSFAPGSDVAPPVRDLKSRWIRLKSDAMFLSWVAEFLSLIAENKPQGCEMIGDELAKEGVNVSPAPKSFVHRYYRALVVSIATFLRKSNIISAIRRFMRCLKRGN